MDSASASELSRVDELSPAELAATEAKALHAGGSPAGDDPADLAADPEARRALAGLCALRRFDDATGQARLEAALTAARRAQDEVLAA